MTEVCRSRRSVRGNAIVGLQRKTAGRNSECLITVVDEALGDCSASGVTRLLALGGLRYGGDQPLLPSVG